MTPEGYDYTYAISMPSIEAPLYGTYTSTETTSLIEVTVYPPPWTCASCHTTKGPVTGPRPRTERRWLRRRTGRNPRRSLIREG